MLGWPICHAWSSDDVSNTRKLYSTPMFGIVVVPQVLISAFLMKVWFWINIEQLPAHLYRRHSYIEHQSNLVSCILWWPWLNCKNMTSDWHRNDGFMSTVYLGAMHIIQGIGVQNKKGSIGLITFLYCFQRCQTIYLSEYDLQYLSLGLFHFLL